MVVSRGLDTSGKSDSHTTRNIIIAVVVLLIIGAGVGVAVWYFVYRKKSEGGTCSEDSDCGDNLMCSIDNGDTEGTCATATILSDLTVIDADGTCPTDYDKVSLNLNDGMTDTTAAYFCKKLVTKADSVSGVTAIKFIGASGTCSGTKTDNIKTDSEYELYACLTKGTTNQLADITAVEANTGSIPTCPTGYAAIMSDLNTGASATKVIYTCTRSITSS